MAQDVRAETPFGPPDPDDRGSIGPNESRHGSRDSRYGTFPREQEQAGELQPDEPHTPPRGHTRYYRLSCIPLCCVTHWKHCRRCYIVAIIMASILTVLLLSIAVYSGVATTLATSKTNGEIFMSANETYSIASGAQSVVLQRVRMEVNNSTTHWKLLQGRCDAVHQTKLKLHQHIEKNTTTNVGYLFYLLNGSKLSVTVQGSGNIKLYRERDASKVNQLEWRCINNEESWLSCDEVCNVTVDSAHYYVCSLPDEPMSFDIDIEKVQYNISEYEPCPVYYHNDEASIASECEMSQNLFHPECVFISASSDDVTYLSHAVGVTVTAVGRRDVTGSLAGAAAATALVVAITVVMFAMVRYRVRHQDKCMKGFQFDWFKNPDPN